ncbi:MAG: hemolysin family protein [Candidatus Krumholzibacteriia bacterium]
MDGSASAQIASAWIAPAGTGALALGAWLGAMLMGGLMTAHYRISGLHANGLLEKETLGPVLRDMVTHPRRFQVTVGTLYLLLTLLGSFAWGSVLATIWGGKLDGRFFVAYAVSALLIWSLGGLAFKRLAAGTFRGYARAVGGLVYPLSWLLRPWAALMLVVMDRLDDTLWAAEAQPHLSAGEIRSLMAEEGDDAALDEDERDMIESIFSFHDRAVREIMVPRIDMVVLDGDADAATALPAVIEEGHSRIPVYRGGVDRVIGILYSKDLLRLVEDGRFTGGGRTLAELVRPAYFVPESKKIDEVLDEFRSKRIHMAVVIDEYGGTAGLVTLEDVIEEIVGEIEDEFDEEQELLTWLDDRRVRLDPKIDLEDLEEILGVALAHVDGAETSETLGGLIYEAAGNVPDKGDRIEVGGYHVTVEKVEDQRMVRVLLESDAPLPGHARRRGG